MSVIVSSPIGKQFTCVTHTCERKYVKVGHLCAKNLFDGRQRKIKNNH